MRYLTPAGRYATPLDRKERRIPTTMNIFNDFAGRVNAAAGRVVAFLGKEGADLGRVVVEPPRDASHGDMATNAAMVLAKPLGEKPRELATRIAAELARDPDVDAAEVAGPGFINLRLRRDYLLGALRDAIGAGDNLAATRRARDRRSTSSMSPPTRPGRCTSAIRAAPSSAMRWRTCSAFAGYDVTREYYINDAGAQVDVLARSAYLRYREALGEDIGAIPEGLYPGDYLKPVGAALADDARARASRHERGGVAADRARGRNRGDARSHPRRPRAPRRRARSVLVGTRADRGRTRPRRRKRSTGSPARGSSTKAGCRRPRGSFPTTGRIASRRSSAPPSSATTSTGR